MNLFLSIESNFFIILIIILTYSHFTLKLPWKLMDHATQNFTSELLAAMNWIVNKWIVLIAEIDEKKDLQKILIATCTYTTLSEQSWDSLLVGSTNKFFIWFWESIIFTRFMSSLDNISEKLHTTKLMSATWVFKLQTVKIFAKITKSKRCFSNKNYKQTKNSLIYCKFNIQI